MRRRPSDWWRGWARETGVLEESGQWTDSVGAVRQVPYLTKVVGHGRLEGEPEEAEVEEGDKEHLQGVHDGSKKRKETVQEVGLDLHGFGIG